MRQGDLVRVTGLIGKHSELGIIVSGPVTVTCASIFYDVMLADGLDFLKGDWLEVVAAGDPCNPPPTVVQGDRG
jgi:hypothetical protein